MSAPWLDARALTLGYDAARPPVLDRFDLAVGAGELVAVLGASGAGKSSLLRVLAGLRRPASGTIEISGRPLDGPHPHVVLMFQEASLLPWLSVERNVAFGLGFKRQPRLSRGERARRVAWAIDEVGLAHARGYHPAQLSGGMAQRVALARAIARQPQVLLLDEPFGALDAATRTDMQDLLLRVVADTRAATVLVTHDIDEALRVADRVVLLDGRGGTAGAWTVASRAAAAGGCVETLSEVGEGCDARAARNERNGRNERDACGALAIDAARGRGAMSERSEAPGACAAPAAPDALRAACDRRGPRERRELRELHELRERIEGHDPLDPLDPLERFDRLDALRIEIHRMLRALRDAPDAAGRASADDARPAA
ncbi:nitrate ABC transporter ATP-binding protein [Burkholderia sp. MSMB1498]|nr:nitrate ABC transporter ATP-binding protein [Burkholderia sp. MSMB1498]